ncbi:MAG: indole-3-glycerol phosphate synthase TrpC, partial [Chloroflexota bacterium]|nr:indole-3-glycerol phosphate synthase TrpC [Chloroflexota bacterium]
DRPAPLDFAAALRRQGVSLIAEVKRASPSKGLLCPDLSSLDLAQTYARNGAVAISVLTDLRFFHGSLDDLARIRHGLDGDIPLLRKDFIFDPYQVYEARAFGADAVLLIAAVLSDESLTELLSLTRELGIAGLVEVHNEEEIACVLPLEPCVVGINNRDLRDFSVDLDTFGRLRSLVPGHIIAVAESGVRTAEDVQRLAVLGADGALVGEALVTAQDPAAKVRELVAGGSS